MRKTPKHTAKTPPTRPNGFVSDNAQEISRIKLFRPITAIIIAEEIESQPIISIASGYLEIAA